MNIAHDQSDGFLFPRWRPAARLSAQATAKAAAKTIDAEFSPPSRKVSRGYLLNSMRSHTDIIRVGPKSQVDQLSSRSGRSVLLSAGCHAELAKHQARSAYASTRATNEYRLQIPDVCALAKG